LATKELNSLPLNKFREEHDLLKVTYCQEFDRERLVNKILIESQFLYFKIIHIENSFYTSIPLYASANFFTSPQRQQHSIETTLEQCLESALEYFKHCNTPTQTLNSIRFIKDDT
jgi:hypothetical protein